MFVGHYGVSFAAKRSAPTIPLWTLFLAVQLLDIVWAPLVLLGVEKVRITPGFTAVEPARLLLHALHAQPHRRALLAIARRPRLSAPSSATPPSRSSIIVGLAVFSHWVLDFIVHAHDLPLFDNSMKVGLGLWTRPRSRSHSRALLLSAGSVVLSRRAHAAVERHVRLRSCSCSRCRRTRSSARHPSSNKASRAISAIVAYVLLALVIWWLRIDTHRSARAATTSLVLPAQPRHSLLRVLHDRLQLRIRILPQRDQLLVILSRLRAIALRLVQLPQPLIRRR